MLLVWDIIGPGRCIENKGGTGQIRVFVEMNAFYTWPGAWFAVLLLLSTSVACGAEAGVKDSWQKLFSRVFLASTSGYGLWNTPLPTRPGTPSTCSTVDSRHSNLPLTILGDSSRLFSRPDWPPLGLRGCPLTRGNFYFPSEHFLYQNFTLDNSNFLLFPFKVRTIGSRLYSGFEIQEMFAWT